jgi:acyl-coenzyme A thioesterase PaaI-like protein
MSQDLSQWLDHAEEGWRQVTLPHMVTKANFVSGDRDGNRMRVRYFLDEQRQLKEKVWFGPGTQGPPGHVHGGSMAAVLDEAMGGAAWLAGKMVVAAEITVSYKEMLPLETCCVVESSVASIDGRKVRTKAEIKDRNGKVYTTASGLFIELDVSKFGDMAERVKDLFEDRFGASASPEAEPDPEACLESTKFIDATHPEIVQCVASIGIEDLSPTERARKLFEFVRDQVRYEFMAKLGEDEYVASRVLADGKGFCVQKAVLLCALGRAAGIPSALVLSDLRDDTLPEKIVSAMGTNIMFHHGLNAFHLNGRWIKADASLSAVLASKKDYQLVEFDGTMDALQAATTLAGEPHCEYVRFHGLYVDLPFGQMMQAFMQAYAQADIAALAEMGMRM